jgi:hypothetical protein
MAEKTSPYGFRYIGAKRRTKEDPRFVTGRGRYAADIQLPGMLHVAIVASPYPSARIRSIESAEALALPGVRYVLAGAELCAAVDALYVGVDAPKVKRYPLADGLVRYAGEWVVAVVAETRAIAEDAVELIEVDYDVLPAYIDMAQPGQGSIAQRLHRGFHFLDPRACQRHIAAGDRGGAGIAARFDPVGHHHVGRPVEALGAVDGEVGRADSLDLRAHRRADCAFGPRRVAALHAIKNRAPLLGRGVILLKIVAAQREIAIRGTAGKGRIRKIPYAD